MFGNYLIVFVWQYEHNKIKLTRCFWVVDFVGTHNNN